MTLEEYIRRRIDKQRSGDGEFLFDAWVEDGSLKILFIHYDEVEDDDHAFIVTGNTVREDEDGANVRN